MQILFNDIFMTYQFYDVSMSIQNKSLKLVHYAA